MALNSAFAKFAHREHLLHDFLSTVEPTPAPPTPQELRSQRKQAKRALRELKTLSPDQIHFAVPTLSQQAEDFKDLEQQMREALGIDQPKPPAKPDLVLAEFEFTTIPSLVRPTPGIEQASETAARQAALEKELRVTLGVPSPSPAIEPTRKPAAPRLFVKRRQEVMLQVRRRDGSEIPFYHLDTCTSSLEAEINAGKKARSFGLTVLRTISAAVKEFECTVGVA